MKNIDDILLELYMLGFQDELENKSNLEYINKSYKLGVSHAVIGDDISSIDLLNNREILKLIYK